MIGALAKLARDTVGGIVAAILRLITHTNQSGAATGAEGGKQGATWPGDGVLACALV